MSQKALNENIKWKDRKHWMWFPFSFTIYSLSEERLFIQSGFFSTHYDETLLYRIVDICLKRSLFQKLFHTGTIILETKADTQGTIYLKNIKNSIEIKNMLSELIETARVQHSIIGREFYGESSDQMD